MSTISQNFASAVRAISRFMRIDLIQPNELGPSEIAAWHSMQEATPALANPFLSPEFTLAAGRLRQESRIAVLTDGACITGFFPFERRRFGVGVPISGWLSACQGLVHAPAAEWDAEELLRSCDLAVWKFDNLISNPKAFRALSSTNRPSPILDLSSGFDHYYTDSPVEAATFLPGARTKDPQAWTRERRPARCLRLS